MEVISIRKSDIPKYHDGSEDKDFYTLDDVMHVALFGSDKEKEERICFNSGETGPRLRGIW